MKLFVDTSGWIALFDESDKYHVTASKAFHLTQNQRLQLVTSDYVFDETMTHLQSKTNKHIALLCGKWILSTRYVEMVQINEDLWQAAWQMFQIYEDKEWAFTDCTSFIVMHKLNLWQVFAFDHHFQQAGFQVWPVGLEQS